MWNEYELWYIRLYISSVPSFYRVNKNGHEYEC